MDDTRFELLDALLRLFTWATILTTIIAIADLLFLDSKILNAIILRLI